jgi:hypothetical protein
MQQAAPQPSQQQHYYQQNAYYQQHPMQQPQQQQPQQQQNMFTMSAFPQSSAQSQFSRIPASLSNLPAGVSVQKQTEPGPRMPVSILMIG